MRRTGSNSTARWPRTGEPVRFENEAKALGRHYDVRAWRVGGPESKKVGILFNDIGDRKRAEAQVQAQLARLNLLQEITRAIGERQDIRSIHQVVIRTLEEHLPVDFCCICLLDPVEGGLIVTSVGAHSESLAMHLCDAGAGTHPNRPEWVVALRERAPDLRGGSQSGPVPVPAAPGPGGVECDGGGPPCRSKARCSACLSPARRAAHSFSSGECEFLRQTSEHVALAAQQAQLYSALQQAYDDPAPDAAVGGAAGAAARIGADGERHRARHQQCHFSRGPLYGLAVRAGEGPEPTRSRPARNDPACCQ